MLKRECNLSRWLFGNTTALR